MNPTTVIKKKFELSSRDARKPIAVPVHAKLIYKYEILYLDRTTIVACSRNGVKI